MSRMSAVAKRDDPAGADSPVDTRPGQNDIPMPGATARVASGDAAVPATDVTAESFNEARRLWLAAIHAERDRRILATTTAIIYVLAEHFDQKRFNSERVLCAYPSQMLIAKLVRISPRAVQPHLITVRELGYLRSQRGGNGASSQYIATIPDAKPTSDLVIDADRKPTSDLVGSTDAKSSAGRSEVQRTQMRSGLPTTSKTSETSDASAGLKPASAALHPTALSSPIEVESSSTLKWGHAPEGAPLPARLPIPDDLRVGHFITVQDAGRRKVVDIDHAGRTVTDGEFETFEFGADGVWRASEIPF